MGRNDVNAKTGRNEACPCGSGRKFKQCCLAGAAKPPLDLAQAAYDSGTMHLLAGRAGEASRALRSALAMRPDYFEAHVNLGNALRALGDHEAAAGTFRSALRLRPEFVELHLNIGASLQALGRVEEAVATYREALTRRPGDARLHVNLATTLFDAQRYDEAEASYRAALALAPDLPEARSGLAGALLKRGKAIEAEHFFRAALALAPGDADMLHGLGDALHEQGPGHEVLAIFRQALAIGPRKQDSYSGLVMKLQYEDAVAPAELAHAHEQFAARFEAPLARLHAAHANARDASRRLRIGYVSPDLRRHSVTYFIEPILANHDRQQFEVHAYYTAANADSTTDRLRSLVDVWHDVALLSDEQLADRVRRDGIDILVDLSGHTLGNRLLVFARKPAPVQVSWIGYPSPTGLRSIDYFVTDACASPPDAGAWDASRLLRLPGVFSCYRPPADAPLPRASSRGSDELVLGSFNNARKISERSVALWSAALRRLPGARLMLKTVKFGDEAFKAVILQRFAAHGIGAERLILRGRSPTEGEHLAIYDEIDIAVDTFPYCGVTTSCEALWMGVPVVSLAGATFVSRMGATLLTAAGLASWVADSEEAFVRAVAELAADADRRASFRRDARSLLRESALLDERGVTAAFEAAVRRAWIRWVES